MLRIVNGHLRDVGPGGLVHVEPPHHVADAQQWREGDKYKAVGRVGPRQSLGVDVLGRLLVEPHPV